MEVAEAKKTRVLCGMSGGVDSSSAAALLVEAEAIARKLGVDMLYTEASELARSSFERAGYRVTHRRDFEIAHEGKAIPIHNYAMEKRLA